MTRKPFRRSGARGWRRVATAAAVAGLLLCVAAVWPGHTARAMTVVERQTWLPINESIRTHMSQKTSVYLYAPAEAAERGTPVIFFSGELGWGPLMGRTASRLAAEGRGVLGVDASDYFKRTLPPEEWAGELRILRAKINRHADRPPDAPILLAGFACGAEMVPYIINRAGTDDVGGALLIAPDLEGNAVLRMERRRRFPLVREEAFDVGEEARRLPELPVALIQGTADEEAKGPDLYGALRGPRKFVAIDGGDRYFNDAVDPYLDAVSAALAWIESGPPAGPSSPPGAGPAPDEPAANPGPDPAADIDVLLGADSECDCPDDETDDGSPD